MVAERTLSLTENLCRSTPSVRVWLSGSEGLKVEEKVSLWVLPEPGCLCEGPSGAVLGLD